MFLRFLSFLFLSLMFFTLFCNKAISQQFPDLTGKYLGQKPPGDTPQKFPSETIRSSMPSKWHGAPTFSPEGREMWWVNMGKKFEIYFSKIADGKWSEPARPSFSENENENNPLFLFNGEYIYFLSFRSGGSIFEVKKTDTGWSDPVNLNVEIPSGCSHGWSFSISKNKTLYLELWKNKKPQIYKAVLEDNKYARPEKLKISNNVHEIQLGPYVNPDEKYLIFSSMHEGGYGSFDLYITFQNSDDTWSNPKNLGDKINDSGGEVSAFVTFDEKFLFFLRNSNVYWVNAEFIEKLKN